MTRLLPAAGLFVLGLLAGFLLYLMSFFALFIAGFSFYALGTGYFLAFAIWLVGAPVSLALSRGRDGQRVLLVFLAGMLVFHVATCLGMAIYAPQTVIVWWGHTLAGNMAGRSV
jgi:hypothetical protein